MATLLRSGWRVLQTRWRRQASTYAQELVAEEEHALGTMATWRKISLFVALPVIAVTTYHAYTKEQEHHEHEKEHGRPEFVPYSHLRLRNKPFPWGDGNHSLIHNPHTNALPDGYED